MNIDTALHDITTALAAGHLLDAFTLVSQLLAETGDTDNVEGATKSMQRFYEMLLEADGSVDAEKYHAQLAQEIYHLSAHIVWSHRLTHAHDLLSDQTQRAMRDVKDANLRRALDATQRYDARDILFRLLWTTPIWDQQLHTTFDDAEPQERQYLLAALTLSLLTTFQEEKFGLLIQYAEDDDTATRMRALTGVALVCLAQHEAIRLYPDAVSQLDALLEKDEVRKDLATLQIELLILHDSPKAQKELDEDIMPAMNEYYSKHGLQSLGFATDSDSDTYARLVREENMTPEQRRAQKRLHTSMSRMARLTCEGYDTNLGNFKKAYAHSFFALPSHFLMPFDPNHDVCHGDASAALLESMTLCDTDRYAMCVMMIGMLGGKAQKQMEALSERTADTDFAQAMDIIDEMLHTPAAEARNYLQCLTRFYKFTPQDKGPLFNPFTALLHLTDCPLLADTLLHDEAYLRRVANKFTELGHAEEALQLWLHFDTDVKVLRKRGLCRQMAGRHAEAVRDYEAALLIEPDDPWTLQQTSRCLGEMGLYEKQLRVLEQLARLTPDDEQATTDLGLCLISLERWREAANIFCKMELEGVREVPSRRATAYCYFQLRDYERALRLYRRLIDTPDAQPDDYLNAGHILFITQSPVAALPLYLKAKTFDQDHDLLLQHGMSEGQIALMHDKIQLAK